MDFILYKNSTSPDKIVDDFLLCDYFEEEPDSYNGIYVSSDDEPQKQEIYYTNSLQETPKEREKGVDSIESHEEQELEVEELEVEELELEVEELEVEELEVEELELEVELEQVKIERPDEDDTEEEEDDEEDDDEIELHLEELKKLIMQIEDKIHFIETKNSTMITKNFFIDKDKYIANLDEISIFKKKKKEYEKSIEFIYNLLMTKNKLI